MPAWIERLLLRWLRAVAPADWCESVLGDLREDLDPGGGSGSRSRIATLLHLTRVACRFTLDAAVIGWQGRSRGGGRMTSVTSDLRHAARTLRRSPAFTLTAVLTLAVAIGANTAIYSALSSLVLRPLPFADSHRLVFVWHKNPQMGGVMVTPPRRAIERWRAATHVFDAVESYTTRSFVVTEGGEPEELSVTLLQPSTLATLGVRPALGRPLVAADAAADAPPVVLISRAFWQSRFGGAPDVVGRTLALGDTAHTVIGVMPRRFELPMGSDVLWAAARAGAPAADSENTLARLAPGVTVEQAQAALDAMTEGDGDLKGWTGQVMRPADFNGRQMKTTLFVLTGAVAFLLLIACVNVANLTLSWHSRRQREVALRQALGASRARLVRYLLVESALLAAAGGALGLAVAAAALRAMALLRPRNLDVLERVAIDAQALAFALGATVLTALLFGLAPALAASRTRLQHVLQAGGRALTPGGQQLRRVLTAAEVALALMLLVGASLLLRSYAKLTAVDPGYDPDGVLSVRVSLPSSRYPAKEPTRRQLFFDDALRSIAALPGVESAAIGNGVPPDTGILFGEIEIDGRAGAASRRSGVFSGGYVTPEYFATLGIPILEGRGFTSDDTVDRDRVVVVGATFAREFWPGERPIGKRLRLQPNGPWSTVVGIAGDVKALSLSADSGRLQLYQARAQIRPGFGAFVVRAAGDPAALVPAIKSRIWTLDPRLPLTDVATADQLLWRSVGQARFSASLLGAFAGCGLLLAVVGVYGVMAVYVAQRQREVGIRMALGATRAAVAARVLRQTTVTVVAGLALGGLGAWWLTRYLQGLLFQTTTADPISFGGPMLAVAFAALAATLVPLARATSVDPSVVLRSE
jgi:predicted permease